MITNKHVHRHIIIKNQMYVGSNFKLLLFYKIDFDKDLYTNMITKKYTNIKIKFLKKNLNKKYTRPLKGGSKSS